MSVKVFLKEISCLRQTALSNMGGLHPICWRPEKNKRQSKGETLPLPIFKLDHQSSTVFELRLGLIPSALCFSGFHTVCSSAPFWFMNFTMYIFLLYVLLTNYYGESLFLLLLSFSLRTRCMNDLLTTTETFEYYKFNWWNLYFCMFSSY